MLFKIIYISCLTGIIGLYGQDSTSVQDAPYNRPFISRAVSSPVAVGGYLEANSNYFSEDGVSEGFTMEMRRFNIFLYSKISTRIKFLAELEFEHGTEEIALETAQIDFEFSPAMVLRAGILVVPIGAFNQNHDSPKWAFVERPLVATEIIPSTLSEVGFGFNGHFAPAGMLLTYDAYLVNGLTDGVVLNDQGRTYLQSGKSEEFLAEDNNGKPAFTGRLGLKKYGWGELGVSHYGGTYNQYRIEGDVVDEKRGIRISAIDFNTEFKKAKILGEFALTTVETDEAISEIFGNKQYGGYLEVLYPLLKRPMFGFKKARINLALRGEKIDYNVGTFEATGTNIYDEVTGFGVALNFRPSAKAVIRANYQHQWIRDVLGNPAAQNAGFQFGVASYF